MANENLAKNQEFVKTNLEKFISLYNNKYILIYEQEVVGSYDTYEVAAEAGVKAFGINGDFLIYEILENEPTNFLMLAEL